MTDAPHGPELRLLVPMDGSASSTRALGALIRQMGLYKDGVEIHLLNVQHALSSHAAAHVGTDVVPEYHREQGLAELKAGREMLEAGKIPHQFHIAVGEPAEVITRYAADHACDQIVMGTRGMGAVSNLMLGSVANKVIHLSSVPVLLMK